MNETDQVEFNIKASVHDASAEDIDWMPRQLLSELRELDVESVERRKGGTAPAGTKGKGIETEGSPEELQSFLQRLKRGRRKNERKIRSDYRQYGIY